MFNANLRQMLADTCKREGLAFHERGTMITIEGPRFSTKAESKMFRSWNADLINMTTVPEVVLANELGLCYASVAMVTDYDCWRENEQAVGVEEILKTFKENAHKAAALIRTVVPQIAAKNWTSELQRLKLKVESNIL